MWYFSISPAAGTRLEQFVKLGEVESVKAVSDIYAPVSCEVLESNENVIDHPEVVNEDPYGGGWLIRVQVDDPSQLDNLLTAEQYDAFLERGIELLASETGQPASIR